MHGRAYTLRLLSAQAGAVLLIVAASTAPAELHFYPPASYPAGPGARSLATSDFDADGAADLAVAAVEGNAVVVLRGAGDGSFVPQSMELGFEPVTVMVGDPNADTTPDLIVLGLNYIAVLLGRGDCTFQPPGGDTTLYPSRQPMAMAVGDLDGDAVDDVVTAVRYDRMAVFLSRGDGTFAPEAAYAGPGSVNVMEIGEFMGNDGVPDIVAASPQVVNVLRGAGAGHLGGVATTLTGILVPDAMDVVDFDADGNLDLVITNTRYSSESIGVYYGRGDGRFGFGGALVSGKRPTAVAAGDLNGDAIADIAATADTPNDVVVFTGRGGRAFDPPMSMESGPMPSSAVVADLNGDLVPDIAVADSVRGEVAIYLNYGQGPLMDVTGFPAGDGPAGVATGEFSGDALSDVAVTDRESGLVAMLAGRGDGRLAPAVFFPAGERPGAVVAADLDRDARTDLVLANGTDPGTIAVLRGVVGGGFSAPRFFLAGVRPAAIALGDVSSDGVLDLAVANEAFGGTVALLRGEDGADFSAASYYPAGIDPAGVTLVDLNGDSFLDVAVANAGSNDVTVLEPSLSSPRISWPSRILTDCTLPVSR